MAKLKILKEGETNIDSSDIWRFAVHSDYPTQKIALTGQTTITILNGNKSGSKTISHSLGFAPTVMASFENYSGRYVKVLGDKRSNRPDDNEIQIYRLESTSSNIKFIADEHISTVAAGANIDITVYYIAFYEDV